MGGRYRRRSWRRNRNFEFSQQISIIRAGEIAHLLILNIFTPNILKGRSIAYGPIGTYSFHINVRFLEGGYP
jgi:hypothetical protein